jgi:hypothetical protein
VVDLKTVRDQALTLPGLSGIKGFTRPLELDKKYPVFLKEHPIRSSVAPHEFQLTVPVTFEVRLLAKITFHITFQHISLSGST